MSIFFRNISKYVLLATCACLLALLLAFSPVAKGASNALAASATGKVIDVSTTEQMLYAYENGNTVYSTPVMTGRGSLPTPLGTFHVFAKLSPTTFVSPWPKGSPNWYPPTHINYALEFKQGGYFLHDATWHSVFGPGTNEPHYDPEFGWQDGSHGCVAMALDAAAWLYNWAPIGTTVSIHG
jgi:lipoprotein-anchoring transpeptidase ErfK/SrfK